MEQHVKNFEAEVFLLIADYGYKVFNDYSNFSNYANWCNYMTKCVKNDELNLVYSDLKSIEKNCNNFFNIGEALYDYILRFFLEEQYLVYSEIIRLIKLHYQNYIA